MSINLFKHRADAARARSTRARFVPTVDGGMGAVRLERRELAALFFRDPTTLGVRVNFGSSWLKPDLLMDTSDTVTQHVEAPPATADASGQVRSLINDNCTNDGTVGSSGISFSAHHQHDHSASGGLFYTPGVTNIDTIARGNATYDPGSLAGNERAISGLYTIDHAPSNNTHILSEIQQYTFTITSVASGATLFSASLAGDDLVVDYTGVDGNAHEDVVEGFATGFSTYTTTFEFPIEPFRVIYLSEYQTFGLDLNAPDDPPAYENYNGESTLVYSCNLHFTT